MIEYGQSQQHSNTANAYKESQPCKCMPRNSWKCRIGVAIANAVGQYSCNIRPLDSFITTTMPVQTTASLSKSGPQHNPHSAGKTRGAETLGRVVGGFGVIMQQDLVLFNCIQQATHFSASTINSVPPACSHTLVSTIRTVDTVEAK